ncbi:MAG: hypothetical protein ACJ8MR_07705 [Povalibacter sp.]
MRTTLALILEQTHQESALPRPPNFKQEKKRREEAQKKRNEQKQAEKAQRKEGDTVDPAQKH